MQYIKSRHTIEDIIKKSRFIGIIIPVADEQEALQNLRQLAVDYPDASHIAFAYRIRTEQAFICRFHDAGEPSGTAGKPIFQHLEGKDLINVLIAVIRYFGGVKLGAGGLTRAYGNAAKHVIESAEIIDYVELTRVRLTLAYPQMQQFEYQLKKLDGRILQQDFSEQINLLVEFPAANQEALFKFLS